MKVLALESYYGGSHKAFLDGWSERSRHDWTLLTLPAHKWKWRLRHSAITFAQQVARHRQAGESWDVLFCSDMLNLAEYLGLCPAGPRLPAVVYFHENQLTYPVRVEMERDYQYVFTNMTTALAATEVWFNSVFHRRSFLDALPAFLKRMPDHQPVDAVQQIWEKSHVHSPGIGEFAARGERRPGPLRILWAARWEHDKNPELFFEALKLLNARGASFRLSVIGEQFRDRPPVFNWAREFFSKRIDRWGYQESRAEYQAALYDADVLVSTANHEFFGLSVLEAVAAGAYPLLPQRLAYPELFEDREFFYDGGAGDLAGKLADLAGRVPAGGLWPGDAQRGCKAVARFAWSHRAAELDQAIEALAAMSSSRP